MLTITLPVVCISIYYLAVMVSVLAVMVSMLASSVVDCEFNSQSGQTKTIKLLFFFYFSTKHTALRIKKRLVECEPV
jgi:hypothetical protein